MALKQIVVESWPEGDRVVVVNDFIRQLRREGQEFVNKLLEEACILEAQGERTSAESVFQQALRAETLLADRTFRMAAA